MKNLWPDFESVLQDKNNSLEILQSQASALVERTGGKVKASFTKTMYKRVNMNPCGEIVEGLTETFSWYQEVEVLDAELQNKTDVNTLFSKEEYKFEIYSDEFRFRIFKVQHNILYPIDLTLDEGIAKELNIDSSQKVNSDSSLYELLERIFNSKKLITIINSIMLSK